jgi:hypothetical protein
VEGVSVSGQDDPEGETPWAMQLVCRIERVAPPAHSAACGAAATAVARLLDDERSRIGGEWHPAMSRWLAGRFRKHARRARGASWARAQLLPGVNAVFDGAEVRAFVPWPVDAIPPEISRLQLQGFELDDPDPVAIAVPEPAGPVVIALATSLSTGKAAAAAAHGAQLAYATMSAQRLATWRGASFPVVVEQPTAERWAALVDVAPVVVRDAGFTEVASGTVTAVARWA